jgi:hypothetical protein
LGDVLRMSRGLKRGSPIDAPRSSLGMLRELVGDTPAESPLTMRELLRRQDYRDLMTAKVAPGQPAFDFELPRHDFSDQPGSPTGATVRLSQFSGVRPVALIFGSYT